MTSCKKQSAKKYQLRGSPAYPANKCQGETKKGNDGQMYTSRRASNGVYRWQKSASKASRKRSGSKKSAKRSGSRSPQQLRVRRKASTKRSVKRSVAKRSSKKRSSKKRSSGRREVRKSKLSGKKGRLIFKVYPKGKHRFSIPKFDRSIKYVASGTDLTTGEQDFEFHGPGNEMPTARIILKEALRKQVEEGKVKAYSVQTVYSI